MGLARCAERKESETGELTDWFRVYGVTTDRNNAWVRRWLAPLAGQWPKGSRHVSRFSMWVLLRCYAGSLTWTDLIGTLFCTHALFQYKPEKKNCVCCIRQNTILACTLQTLMDTWKAHRPAWNGYPSTLGQWSPSNRKGGHGGCASVTCVLYLIFFSEKIWHNVMKSPW